MPTLNDYNSAQRVLDSIRQAAAQQIQQQIPQIQFAQVISVDRVNRQAVVRYSTDTSSVTIRILADDGPYGANDIVEVSGGRVQRVIYSATAPGGTYISPAFVDYMRISGGLTSTPEIGAVTFNSNSGNPGVGNAWLLGQWTALPLVGIVKVRIMQGAASSNVIAEYEFYTFNSQTNGTWAKVHPKNKTRTPGGLLDFALEVNVGNDSILGTLLQLRVRQTVADGGFTNAFRVDVELIGNWIQNDSIIETLVAAPAAVTGYITEWSTPERGVFTYVGTSGIGSPAFSSSWTNYQDAGWMPAKFFIDKKGKVRIYGLIAGGTTGTIFTLPPGYRPDSRLIYTLDAGTNGSGEVYVNTDGTVQLHAFTNGGSNGYFSLTGIAFFPAGSVPWTIAALQTGYAASTVTGTSVPKFYVDEDGCVHWQGNASITGSTNTPIVLLSGPTVPAFAEEIQICSVSGGSGRLDIQASTPRILYFTGMNGSVAGDHISLDAVEYIGVGHTLNVFGDAPTPHSALSAVNSPGHSYGSGYTPYYYAKDSAGIVYAGGLLIGWTALGALMFYMPAGFRPSNGLIFKAAAGDQIARIDYHGPDNNGTNQGAVVISDMITGATFGNTTYVSVTARYYSEF